MSYFIFLSLAFLMTSLASQAPSHNTSGIPKTSETEIWSSISKSYPSFNFIDLLTISITLRTAKTDRPLATSLDPFGLIYLEEGTVPGR